MKKIVCVGNAFAYPDSFGMEIYNQLQTQEIEDLEIVEGGVGGLNLAPHFDTPEPVLIVDHGVGFNKKILSTEDIKKIKIDSYNHSNAFIYLLKSIEKDNILIYISNSENWKKEEISLCCQEILKIARGM